MQPTSSIKTQFSCHYSQEAFLISAHQGYVYTFSTYNPDQITITDTLHRIISISSCSPMLIKGKKCTIFIYVPFSDTAISKFVNWINYLIGLLEILVMFSNWKNPFLSDTLCFFVSIELMVAKAIKLIYWSNTEDVIIYSW